MNIDYNKKLVYQRHNDKNGSLGRFSLVHNHDFICVDTFSNIRTTFLPELKKTHINNFYIISLCTDGEGIYCIDGENIRVEKGTLIFLHPGQLCSIVDETGVEGVRIAFSPYVYDKMESHFANIIKYGLFRNFNSIKIEKENFREYLNEHFIELLSESNTDRQSAMYNLKLYTLLYFIMAKIYEHSPNNSDNTGMTSRSFKLFIRFMAMIDNNYNTNHRVDDYLRALHVGHKELAASTKEHCNKNPHDMIIDKCIFEAKRLLTYSHLSIKEIALELGYNEPSNFSLIFKKYTKLTPNQYRRISANENNQRNLALYHI